MDGWDGWMDGWMDGSMDGSIYEWMDGWMELPSTIDKQNKKIKINNILKYGKTVSLHQL